MKRAGESETAREERTVRWEGIYGCFLILNVFFNGERVEVSLVNINNYLMVL